jgi:flotillin
LQLSGDLTGIDVSALLRRLSGAAGDGVTRVPITSDGDGVSGNGAKGNGASA